MAKGKGSGADKSRQDAGRNDGGDNTGRRDPITIDLQAASVRVEPREGETPQPTNPDPAPETVATGATAPEAAPAEATEAETTAAGATHAATSGTAHPASETPADPAPASPETVTEASASSEPLNPSTIEATTADASASPDASIGASAETSSEARPSATTAPVAAEQKPGLAMPIAAALVGGVLGLGAAWGLAASGNWPGAGGSGTTGAPADVAALEKKIADLSARPTTGAAVDLTPIEKRLAELDAALKALPKVEPAAVDAARSAAADNAKAIEARAADLAALRSRVEAIETKPAPPPSPTKTEYDAAIAKLTQSVTDAGTKATADLASARAALEEANGDLKARMGVFESDARALSKRLLDASAATQANLQSFTDEQKKAMERLQGRIASLEDVRATVDGALTRITAVEAFASDIKALASGQQQAGTKIADLGQRVATIDTIKADVGKAVDGIAQKTDAIDGRVAALGTTVGKLEAWTKDGAAARRDAILAVSLGALRAAVDAGRPYQGELDTATGIAGGSVELKPLAPFAATGVSTPAKLAADFKAIAPAILDVTEPKPVGNEAGVFGAIFNNATRVVRIRPEGEAAGSGPGAIVARIEAKLGKGDFAGAAAEWDALPDAGKRVSEAWAQALKARVAADKALTAVTGAVLAKLSQPSQ
ncbi:hypothetical protein [Methyloraptor flagellatus]|uniref:Chromosome segregation ATPase n=1 Tax=Methyloraptor flagellatus TaxID=3162530 RepID=A0AAU7X8W1_9HYPH